MEFLLFGWHWRVPQYLGVILNCIMWNFTFLQEIVFPEMGSMFPASTLVPGCFSTSSTDAEGPFRCILVSGRHGIICSYLFPQICGRCIWTAVVFQVAYDLDWGRKAVKNMGNIHKTKTQHRDTPKGIRAVYPKSRTEVDNKICKLLNLHWATNDFF